MARHLLALLRESLVLLASYKEKRDAIDLAARVTMILRIHRPPNEFEEARAGVLAKCEEIAGDADLVGWHCRRLTDAEAGDIRLRGMSPLSPELSLERLARAGEGDLFPAPVLTTLRVTMPGEPDRRAMIHFILSRVLLREAEGVYRLLCCRGGEAL